MSFVNFSTKEITSKIVYYGPGLCGKTTTLQYVYDSIVPENKGQIVSLATDVDRTIYFDFLPLKLGKIQNFSVRIQLYTVPGQVRYNSTRKLVLSGTDGVVFVADSQRELMEENDKSFKNLVENLKEHGLALKTLPHIFQYNKRDLPSLASIDDLNKRLNLSRAAHFETCAMTGEGVLEGLKAISKLVMQDLNRKGVVNRKKAISYHPRTRTDSILRPLVGVGIGDSLASATVIEEYLDPFMRGDDRTAPRSDQRATVPAATEPFPLSTLEMLEPEGLTIDLPRPAGTTFSAIFEEQPLAERMSDLEDLVNQDDYADVPKLAQQMFFSLVEDDRFFPPDMTESSRISMLGISLRKYAHFYRLLSQTTLTRAECLFLLHFLVDVHFGKGMP